MSGQAALEEVEAAPRVGPAVADFVELTKPRLTAMAVVTAMASFWLGLLEGPAWGLALHTFVGTVLMGAGGATLNQVLERDLDARMARTRRRPLPAGRMAVSHAAWFGCVLSVAAPVYFWLYVNTVTALLCVLALVSYVVLYTVLKTRTPLSTVVGAVPGALPCMMGWTAARGWVGYEGWVLFAILFLWQMPHFLAIAWMYRQEYEQAGMLMLPVVEPDGYSTGRQVIVWCLALIPVSMAPAMLGITGRAYFWIALLLGLLFLAAGVRMALQRTRVSARNLLLASILYLPLPQGAMLLARWL